MLRARTGARTRWQGWHMGTAENLALCGFSRESTVEVPPLKVYKSVYCVDYIRVHDKGE